MDKLQQVVTIVGGTGFVGRYVVKLLAASGYTVRVIVRRPAEAQDLRVSGNVGQIVAIAGDLAQPDSLSGKLDGSFAVINLVGILFESGKQTYNAIQAQGAEKLAQIACAAGAQRFIQISALGVDKAAGTSQYARSKALGEKAVLAAFPEASILRPSVIFGPEDDFFNQFAGLAGISPALPLIGDGKMRFQPVYVGDVAKAIVACLSRSDTLGQTYELGGAQIITFREILEYTLHTIGKKRLLLPLPFAVAAALGAIGEGVFCLNPFKAGRKPFLTRDQVRLLKYDNIVSPDAQGFAHLDISPTAMEVIVPDYLRRFHRKAVA